VGCGNDNRINSNGVNFLKKFEPKLDPVFILKTAGIILLFIFGVSFAFSILRSSLYSLSGSPGISAPAPGAAPRDAMDSSLSYGNNGVSVESARDIQPILPPYGGGYVAGGDAEEFEVTEYSARFETRDFSGVCSAVFAIKQRGYVVFESAHDYDRGCRYAFKVERARSDEIVSLLKGLEPEDFSENTYTIKRMLEDVTSRIDILRRKQEAIEETLEDAIASYDAIIAVASRAENVDALARLIEGKVRIIEQLTQERIQVSAQLEHALRLEADHLDRLAYAHFSVHAAEDKFIDKDIIRDSWNAAIKKFVRDANYILQGATVRFITFLLIVGQWALYAFVLLFAAKFGWQVVRNIWGGKKNIFRK